MFNAIASSRLLKGSLTIACVASAGLLISTTASCQQNTVQTLEQRKAAMPQRGIMAHRGARTTHPENTLVSFREALRLGAHMMEADARITADGQAVLMENDTLTRTTNVAQVFPDRANDKVNTFTVAEIKRLEAGSWKDERFAGEPVPTLGEFLDLMPINAWVNIDIHDGPELARVVAREVVRRNMEHQVIVSVRNEETAQAVRDVRQETGTHVLMNNMYRQAIPQYVQATLEGGYDFIQFYHVHPDPEPEHYQALRQAGVAIGFCCSDDPDTIREWFDAGVQFPLVNDVPTGMRIAREKGIAPMQYDLND